MDENGTQHGKINSKKKNAPNAELWSLFYDKMDEHGEEGGPKNQHYYKGSGPRT
jgi:hypothetical protein